MIGQAQYIIGMSEVKFLRMSVAIVHDSHGSHVVNYLTILQIKKVIMTIIATVTEKINRSSHKKGFNLAVECRELPV
jgi:hypothetical protein